MDARDDLNASHGFCDFISDRILIERKQTRNCNFYRVVDVSIVERIALVFAFYSIPVSIQVACLDACPITRSKTIHLIVKTLNGERLEGISAFFKRVISNSAAIQRQFSTYFPRIARIVRKIRSIYSRYVYVYASTNLVTFVSLLFPPTSRCFIEFTIIFCTTVRYVCCKNKLASFR